MLKSYIDYRLGGKPRYYVARKPVSPMILPDGVLKSVIFLCYRDKKGNIRFGGTAFFVSNPDEETGLAFSCTVTALHVIASIKVDSGDGQVLLRLNRKDGTWEYHEVHVSEWTSASSQDEFVDVSILDWTPDADKYEVRYIPFEMFITQKLLDNDLVGVGNEIIIVGLFINHARTKRNSPIVRYGNIAMLPEEFLETRYGKMRGYLIESRSIGGLSGSPVFVYTDKNILTETSTGSLSAQRILLLGLVHGHYDIRAPVVDALVEDTPKEEVINMGVAMVAPAIGIQEAVEQNEKLQKSREKQIAEEKDRQLPTPDFAGSDSVFTEEDFEEALRKVSRKDKSKNDGEK